MSFEICKAEVYRFRNKKGRRISDYIIKNGYDGRFLVRISAVMARWLCTNALMRKRSLNN